MREVSAKNDVNFHTGVSTTPRPTKKPRTSKGVKTHKKTDNVQRANTLGCCQRGGGGNIHKAKYGGHSTAKEAAAAELSTSRTDNERPSMPERIKSALGIGKSRSRSRSRTRA